MSTPIDPPLSRRAARQAEQATQGAQPEAFAQPLTRRGSGGTPVSVPSSAPTDVAYRTQVRPRVPHYDAPPAAHTVIPASAPNAVTPAPTSGATAHTALPPVPPPVAPAATDAPVRRRDFRPPAEQHDPTPPVPPAAGFDTELQYHTLLAPRRDAPPAPPAAPPAAHVIEVPPAAPAIEVAAAAPAPTPHAAETTAVPEQTLSRRELRALRDQTATAPEPVAAPAAPPAAVAEAAAAAFIPPAPAAAAPPAPAASAPLVPPPAPGAPALIPPAPAASVAAVPESVPPLAQPDAAPASLGSAPTGSHWSVGIDADDDPFENTFSREVGSTSSLTSTNALVLPEMPTGSIAGPVTGTGEIIITGMIDLPRVVSSTGTVPTVHESPDIDDLLEPGDLAVAPPDAAPVSAAKAVSAHTQAQTIITPSGSRMSSNTVTTALVAATVVMAVVAIGLFVVAAVNGLF